jgi:dTDP-4-dehydrorhamnose reductase
MRILITGADGQLGKALEQALAAHEVTGYGHRSLDIADAAGVHGRIAEGRPDVVINCAAWTDTAGCEADPARAYLVNGDGAGHVAAAAKAVGALVLHVSSNEVFDGDKAAPYVESDEVNPVNEYGRSKELGERRVAEATDDHQIVRTSWLYGPGRSSFPEKLIERATTDGRVRLVTDEIASPTWTVDLAAGIAALIETGERGIFHLVNDGSCSRKEWGEEVLRLSGIDVPVEEATQEAFQLPFRKPPDSSLANVRAAALGIQLRPWKEALSQHLDGAASPPREIIRA